MQQHNYFRNNTCTKDIPYIKKYTIVFLLSFCFKLGTAQIFVENFNAISYNVYHEKTPQNKLYFFTLNRNFGAIDTTIGKSWGAEDAYCVGNLKSKEDKHLGVIVNTYQQKNSAYYWQKADKDTLNLDSLTFDIALKEKVKNLKVVIKISLDSNGIDTFATIIQGGALDTAWKKVLMKIEKPVNFNKLSIQISYVHLKKPKFNWIYFDNLKIYAVPEPTIKIED